MLPHPQSNALVHQPWLTKFLQDHGFVRHGDTSFSNGRATVRFDHRFLFAIPADGSKTWRCELANYEPKAVGAFLAQVLTLPGFAPQSVVDAKARRLQSAEAALQSIVARMDADPKTGEHLKGFLCGLFNGHHPVNLWRMRHALDLEMQLAVSEIFAAWMQNLLPETSLRKAIERSGGIDR